MFGFFCLSVFLVGAYLGHVNDRHRRELATRDVLLELERRKRLGRPVANFGSIPNLAESKFRQELLRRAERILSEGRE